MRSSPDRGTIVERVFSPTGQLVRFSHLMRLSFKILNLFGINYCPHGEAVITGHLHLSSMR